MALELAGKYRLICELGQGGMAVVYLAVALGASNFRKLAVVKLIRPQVANERDILQMFFDEAQSDPTKWEIAKQAYQKTIAYPPPDNRVYGYAWFVGFVVSFFAYFALMSSVQPVAQAAD